MKLNDFQLFHVVLFLINRVLYFCDGSVLCQEPSPVPNAYREWSGIGMTAEVNYTCYTHYVLMSGDLVRTCVNGVYTGDEPVCKLDCGVPRNLEGATVSYPSTTSDLTSVSKAKYDCLPGLKVKGNSKNTENIAEGCKAFLADGSNVDHVVDGDTTCKPLTDTSIDIHLNDTYKIMKIFIVHNLASINKISVSAIQNSTGLEKTCVEMDYGDGTVGITKTLYSSKFYASAKCYGDIVRIVLTLSTTLSICDIMIYGNLFIGDCGQPAVKFGQTVEYTNTTEGSTALLSCVPPFYPENNHGVITCQGTAWTSSKLICTDRHDNIADEIPNNLYDMVLDNNYTTCVNIGSSNGIPSEWSIDLGQDYEVNSLSVTFGDMDLSQPVKAVIVHSSGKATTCQYERPKGAGVVVAFVCSYARVTRNIKLTGGDELNLCDVKIKGRYYDEPLECYNSFKGIDYKGTQNVTSNGRVCLPWVSIPEYSSTIENFPDVSYDETGNHCRNPSKDGRGSPWCFISPIEWHYCSVPKCGKYIVFASYHEYG
ncbi:hypothetical protein LOTGIDRAFT_152606 [Lottia gigantea]|uniref:Kringle domain-containing protein n=1 Tax=Lottia gigantea TaxID=225164 RepID=V4ARP5_LOTGI|nr:hypothetical protein LOTGIDRAFT_152606 [Lottia gigantea]ESO97515.1 hypothetical protein LOTGIDRAFT_152606 [Lottia gigantea]